MDSRRLWRPGMDVRLQEIFRQIEAGEVDPLGFWVSATTLRQVIRRSPGSDALKRKLITFLNRRVVRDKPIVNVVVLGAALAAFAEKTDDEDLIQISRNIGDLDQLPFVIANGKPVH